jgi:hypothetical protein
MDPMSFLEKTWCRVMNGTWTLFWYKQLDWYKELMRRSIVEDFGDSVVELGDQISPINLEILRLEPFQLRKATAERYVALHFHHLEKDYGITGWMLDDLQVVLADQMTEIYLVTLKLDRKKNA